MPSLRRPSLTQMILLGLVVGGIYGYVDPAHATQLGWIRDIFLHLIKSIIAPLVFATVVVGIAGGGDLMQVGRMGWKSLLYFELVTTVALFLGLAVVNLVKPGLGIHLAGDPGVLATAAQNHPMTLVETLVHIFPASIIDAMARGDVLEIVAFAVVFGIATAAIGGRGAPIVAFCDSLAQVMFRFTGYVMLMAPLGVGAAMAVTIGHQGQDVLQNLGMLVGALYLALGLFVLIVFGAVAAIIRLPLLPFLRAVREPFTLAFVTTSSESALPKAMEAMEKLGVPRRVVGFVMPAGYSFNLDGTTLYLAMASVFIAQAVATTVPGFVFPWSQQIAMMLTLMVTSKGVAAVPRASLVILIATVNAFMPAPWGAIGVAMIFGVDELMDMARTSVNLLGNCLATVVVARWEGVFDDEKARAFRG